MNNKSDVLGKIMIPIMAIAIVLGLIVSNIISEFSQPTKLVKTEEYSIDNIKKINLSVIASDIKIYETTEENIIIEQYTTNKRKILLQLKV